MTLEHALAILALRHQPIPVELGIEYHPELGDEWCWVAAVTLWEREGTDEQPIICEASGGTPIDAFDELLERLVNHTIPAGAPLA